MLNLCSSQSASTSFLQLAAERALLGQEQVLGELLRDGRAALRHAAVQHVGDERADDAERIDAVMRVEAAVLDGDEGLRHVGRQFLERHRGAAHVAAGGERLRRSASTIWIDGGRLGISSDWIGGRWAPTQTAPPMRPMPTHSASTTPQ